MFQTSMYFDHEDNIPIKKEIKEEIKSEPLEEVHDGSNDEYD